MKKDYFPLTNRCKTIPNIIKMQLKAPHFLLGKLPVICFMLFMFLTFTGFGQQTENGKYLEKYENGKVKTSGHYKNGIKKGNWFYYHPNGRTEKREHWKNGQLNIVYVYNEKGRLASITDKNGHTRYMPDCNCR